MGWFKLMRATGGHKFEVAIRNENRATRGAQRRYGSTAVTAT